VSDSPAQTVFIVDDDAAVRDSIAELVGSVGLPSEGYPSGPSFLQAYRRSGRVAWCSTCAWRK